MKYIYYIAERFLLSENKYYHHGLKTEHFSEIVSMDSILCKERYFDLNTNEYIGRRESYDEITHFKYTRKEQIIKCLKVEKSHVLEECDEFEFCGYDILDYYEENSWITNYDIDYDINRNIYTKYGLLDSIENVFTFIEEYKIKNQNFQNEEYCIFAVWRKF